MRPLRRSSRKKRTDSPLSVLLGPFPISGEGRRFRGFPGNPGNSLAHLSYALTETLENLEEATGNLTDPEKESERSEPAEAPQAVAPERIAMPFFHGMTPDIIANWSLSDFDPDGPNDQPNLNLTVMGMILATNIELTVGKYPWSLVEYGLDRLGFTNIVHQYFGAAQKVNHPAMAFGISPLRTSSQTPRRSRADSMRPGSTRQMS